MKKKYFSKEEFLIAKRVSFKANRLKSNMSLDTIQRLYDYIFKTR